jgi:HSP20 family protein
MDPLTRWNQVRWRQLNAPEDLQHTLRSLFSRSQVHWPVGPERVAHWIPLVNISKDVEGYVIKAELPHVKKEDVTIRIEDGMLIITGDRKFEKNSKKDHPIERADGRFVHAFSLPNDARPSKVTTEFNDGVLKVHLARNEKARLRLVEPEAATSKQSPNPNQLSSGCGINE